MSHPLPTVGLFQCWGLEQIHSCHDVSPQFRKAAPHSKIASEWSQLALVSSTGTSGPLLVMQACVGIHILSGICIDPSVDT